MASLKKRKYRFLSNEIKLAKHAGFCYGVKRAVETTKKLKQENPHRQIFVLGELIHNSDVINELETLGIKTIDSIESLPSSENGSDCGICVIRSHGLAGEEIEKIVAKGYEIVDLTCPDVRKVQQKAEELAKIGFAVVIVGKSEHPEVAAIYANARRSSDLVFVVSNSDELNDDVINEIKLAKGVGVVSQTTQRVENLQGIVSELTKISKELRVFNTICPSTARRQSEATELASASDLMVVVGSKKSANTTHLAEKLKNVAPTIHIENDRELENLEKQILNSNVIGVTAGASTPDYVINAVIKKLEESKTLNNVNL